MAAVALLPACLAASDTPDTRGGKQKLAITVHLKAPDGSAAPCPAGFQNLLLSATTEEQHGQVQTIVPCQSDGTTTVELFTRGERKYKLPGDNDTIYTESFTPNYTIIVSITDPTGAVARATSLTTHLKLDHDQTLAVDLYPDAGLLLMSWQLFSKVGGRVFTCTAVALDQIELQYRKFTPDGDPPAPSSSVRWPCDEVHPPYYKDVYATGQGFTPALAPDDYLGVMVGYRNGVEVARTEGAFNIRTGNALTESELTLTVADR